MDLGKVIHKVRKEKNLTLKDVSTMTKLTVSLLSQIENNRALPSISSLLAISKALNIPIGTILEQESTYKHPVIRYTERPVVHTMSGITYYLLSTQFEKAPIEVLWAEYGKGASTEVQYAHDGFECGVVIQGKLEVVIKDEHFVLNQGDSITIKSSDPHKMNNLQDGSTFAVWINYPPTF